MFLLWCCLCICLVCCFAFAWVLCLYFLNLFFDFRFVLFCINSVDLLCGLYGLGLFLAFYCFMFVFLCYVPWFGCLLSWFVGLLRDLYLWRLWFAMFDVCVVLYCIWL